MDPRPIVEQIRQAWAGLCQRGGEAGALPDGALPDPAVIERVIDVAFWASMRTEEQRGISFRLACCTPEQLARRADQRAPVLLSEPKALSIAELVRLSPALDFRQSLVGVCQASALDGHRGDEVMIWGVIDTGLSWWEHIRGEPRRRVHSSPPPDCLTVSSQQPGTLDISRRGQIMLSLRHGRRVAAVTEIFHGGPVGRFFAGRAQQLVDEACEIAGGDFTQDARTEHDAASYYGRFLDRLVVSMQEFRRGGAVVFVPDEWSLASAELRQRLLIRFQTSTSSTWELLRRCLVQLQRSTVALDRIIDRETIAHDDLLEYLVNRQQREQHEDLVRERAALLASLTRVDGCVVLKTDFELLGFGTEIVWAEPALSEIFVAQDREATAVEPISIDGFGTRHRSAFRLCASDERLLAIVLSSDGDLRLVKRLADRVVLWNASERSELAL